MKNLSILVLSMVLNMSLSFAGNEGSGGGYKATQGRKIIAEAATQMRISLQGVHSQYFIADESRRKLVIDALSKIDIRPLESRQRDGDELLMDYDYSSSTIIVLKPFFDIFTAASEIEPSVKVVKKLLLHEVAHLWGFDEQDAEAFAKDILNPIAKGVLVNLGTFGTIPGLEVNEISVTQKDRSVLSEYVATNNFLIINSLVKDQEFRVFIRLCSSSYAHSIAKMFKMIEPLQIYGIPENHEASNSDGWANGRHFPITYDKPELRQCVDVTFDHLKI